MGSTDASGSERLARAAEQVTPRSSLGDAVPTSDAAETPEERQRAHLERVVGDTQTIIVQSSNSFDEKKEVLDLAFTPLPPDIAILDRGA